MSIKKLLLSLFLLGSASIAQATSVLPHGAAPNNTMDKVSQLYYLTFASATFNPQAAVGLATQQVCPAGGTFVNSSAILIPSFPGITPGPSGVYLWQCSVLVNYWMAANGTKTLDTRGVDPALTNINSAFNINDWESYSKISDGQYTAYQFPNNSYVPLGVGGSGLGCLGAGGSSNVSCTSAGAAISATTAGNGQWLYYVQPGEALSCTIHRDYGSTTPCSGSGCPCDTTTSVQPGQALIGACCNGTWKTTTTSFTNPNFTTCNYGC